MSPIPGEPLDPQQPDLTTADGRKVKLKLPGSFPKPVKPSGTSERGADEPPRDDPRPPGVNPNHAAG
jgi:hypothetical protein